MQEPPLGEPERTEKPLFFAVAVGLLEPLAGLLVVFGGVFTAAALYRLVVPSAGLGGQLDLPMALVGITAQAVLLAAVGLHLRRRHGIGTESPPQDRLPVLHALLGGPAVFLVSLLAALAMGLFGVEVREQAWVLEQLADPRRTAILAPWIVLLAPWAEEVFFRGYALPFIGRGLGPVTGVGLSAVLFALIHWNPPGFASYFAMGCVLGALYLRTGRLWVPVIAHAIHNGLVLLVSLLAPTASP